MGVDLAAQPERTGLAVVSWEAGRAELVQLRVGVTNADVVAAADPADKIGIDCPLGWPAAFVEFVAAHQQRRLDPAPFPVDGSPRWNRDLVLRRTDLAVRQAWPEHRLLPLSVSSDRIAVPAMRCAVLLGELGLGDADRSGHGRLVEVYPAASLAVWGLPSRGYKKPTPVERDRREQIVAGLRDRCPWLACTAADLALARTVDHALDALVAALSARAAALDPPVIPPADRHAAATEGWIAVPRRPAGELAGG